MEPYMRTIYQDLIKVCHVCHNIALQVKNTSKGWEVLFIEENPGF